MAHPRWSRSKPIASTASTQLLSEENEISDVDDSAAADVVVGGGGFLVDPLGVGLDDHRGDDFRVYSAVLAESVDDLLSTANDPQQRQFPRRRHAVVDVVVAVVDPAIRRTFPLFSIEKHKRIRDGLHR